MSKTNVCESLEDVLDGLTGQVTEQGWEGLDRYYKRPFRMYSTLLSLLKLIDEDRGQKMEDMALEMGLMEKDIKIVKKDSGPPWEGQDKSG